MLKLRAFNPLTKKWRWLNVNNVGGSSFWEQSGEGSPVGTVTPAQQGARYHDTANGALYLAVGVTNVDWAMFGGYNFDVDPAPGIGVQPVGGNLGVFGGYAADPFNGYLYLGDSYAAWNGTGNGLIWRGNGTDGEQVLEIKTGETGQHAGTLQDADGNMTVPGVVSAEGFVGVGITQQRTVTLLAADVLALNSIPFELVPLPGEGFIVQPIAAVWQRDAGTIPYIYTGERVIIYSHGGYITWLETTEMFDNPGNRFGCFLGDSGGFVVDPANIDGAGLMLSAANNNPIDGDGDLTITVTYVIVPIS